MPSNKEITVLIVDDELLYLETLCEILEFEGYSTLVASGGHEAFKIVENNKIDVIVSDIRMPQGDGLQLLLNVRKRDAGFPPIILVTGFSIQDKESLHEKGADLVLKKPVDPVYLLEKIAELAKGSN